MYLIKRLTVFLIRLVSFLPFGLLYIKSDLLAFLLYHVVRYRHRVVMINLRRSFPDKSEAEVKSIAKKFYRNFSDLILEVIKSRSITRKQFAKRISFSNYELLEDLFDRGKSVIVTMGHCGNWEWTPMQLETISRYRVFAVVKPLNDPFFEAYLKKLRTRFGTRGGLIQFKNTLRTMVAQRDEMTMTIFAGDQTPTRNEINYWTTFLNQETPVYLGIEKLAKSLDCAVVFFDIQRRKRGYYNVDISLITDDPRSTEEFEITEKHVGMLEKAITEHPDNWLWSHRRWKHQKGTTGNGTNPYE